MWQTIIILQENKVIFLSYLHFNSNVLQHFSSSTGNFNACRGCLGKERLCLSKTETSLGLKRKILIQFPTPIFVLLSGLLPYSFTTDGEATGKIQGFGFAFAKEIYPS